MRILNAVALSALMSTHVFAVDYANHLSGKTLGVTGTFGQHDFADAESAFDWAFTTPDAQVYQLQGNPPSDTDVFGWKSVNIASPEPAWYMLFLNDDVDEDGTTKFDWILVDPTGRYVYKLAGVTASGNFDYSDPIAITATVAGDEQSVVFETLSNSGNSELDFSGGSYDISDYAFPAQSGSMTHTNYEWTNFTNSLVFGDPDETLQSTYYFTVSGNVVHETSDDTDETSTILGDRIENVDNESQQLITTVRYADVNDLIAKQDNISLGDGVYIDGECTLSAHLTSKSVNATAYSDVIEITCRYEPTTTGATGESTAITYLAKDIGQIYWIHTGCIHYQGIDVCFKSEEILTGTDSATLRTP